MHDMSSGELMFVVRTQWVKGTPLVGRSADTRPVLGALRADRADLKEEQGPAG